MATAGIVGSELEDRIAELEEENETLTEKLDSIGEILGDEEDDEDDYSHRSRAETVHRP